MKGVKIKDRGYKKLLQRVYGLKLPVIKVGIFDAEGAKTYEDVVTVLDVAIWNEFGTTRIPERSFIRAWFDENETKCREAVKRMTMAVVAGKYTPDQALELLGMRFVGEIQNRMSAGIAPANAPSTIAKKGSSTPLINRGQLRSSVTFKVEQKS